MNWLIKQTVDLNNPPTSATQEGALMVFGDGRAHDWRVRVTQNGQEVDLAGWNCVAYFVRYDQTTVMVNGSVAGAQASVTFDSTCYAIPGKLLCIMRIAKGDVTMTIGYMNTRVVTAVSDIMYDPGDTVPSLDYILALINQMENSVGQIDASIDNANAAALDARAAAGAVSDKRYGVSWTPGQSSPTLTRIWNSVGKVAQVGTDIVDTTYQNDFDTIAPFNRRRCCGDFNSNGVMRIAAYDGEPGFRTDGSAGNVWVEQPIVWYFQDLDNGQLGVAPQEVAIPGWAVHPAFVMPSGEILTKLYLPAYQMSLVNSKAASVSGQHCRQGSMNSLTTDVRTYSSARAHLETTAIRHLEWLLFTIEFATLNCQSIMGAASGMPYSASDLVYLDGTNVNFVVCTAAIGDKFAVGQTIYLGPTYSTTDTTSVAYNYITSIAPCDITGALAAGGTYRKITFAGVARTVTGGTTTISTRGWRTGSCDAVKAPSGTPTGGIGTPASDVKHACRYRYRENTYGNIYSGCQDLLITRTGDGSGDPYVFHWNWLSNPTKYNNGTLTADYTEIATNNLTANGYIKTAIVTTIAPHVLVPTVLGASATMFVCDNYWYPTSTLTVAFFGGNALDGSLAGLRALHANTTPSSSSWHRGGGLCVSQSGGA